MVDVLELGGDVSQEVHAGAYSQHCPALACNSAPPRQGLTSKKHYSHFNLLLEVYHAAYHAVILEIEQPVF